MPKRRITAHEFLELQRQRQKDELFQDAGRGAIEQARRSAADYAEKCRREEARRCKTTTDIPLPEMFTKS
jgi:hypothetical protein